jgi:hypothetical protein
MEDAKTLDWLGRVSSRGLLLQIGRCTGWQRRVRDIERHINIVKRETGWPMQPGAHGAHLSNCLYPLASTIVL